MVQLQDFNLVAGRTTETMSSCAGPGPVPASQDVGLGLLSEGQTTQPLAVPAPQ